MGTVEKTTQSLMLMSAAPRYLASSRRRRLKQTVSPSQVRRTQAARHPAFGGIPAQRRTRRHRPSAGRVESLPLRQKMPLLLRSLLWLQRGSSAIAFGLTFAVLLTYASMVFIQQQWSEEYQKLESLRREARNLTEADAIFKDNLAQQAERLETGLVMPTPENNIYLSPSSERQPPKPTTEKPQPEDKNAPSNLPLGY